MDDSGRLVTLSGATEEKKFSVGDNVLVESCSQCPDVVGKTGTVKGFNESCGIQVNFGRGRPQKNRPEYFSVDQLKVISVIKPVDPGVAQEDGKE